MCLLVLYSSFLSTIISRIISNDMYHDHLGKSVPYWVQLLTNWINMLNWSSHTQLWGNGCHLNRIGIGLRDWWWIHGSLGELRSCRSLLKENPLSWWAVLFQVVREDLGVVSVTMAGWSFCRSSSSRLKSRAEMEELFGVTCPVRCHTMHSKFVSNSPVLRG